MRIERGTYCFIGGTVLPKQGKAANQLPIKLQLIRLIKSTLLVRVKCTSNQSTVLQAEIYCSLPCITPATGAESGNYLITLKTLKT